MLPHPALERANGLCFGLVSAAQGGGTPHDALVGACVAITRLRGNLMSVGRLGARAVFACVGVLAAMAFGAVSASATVRRSRRKAVAPGKYRPVCRASASRRSARLESAGPMAAPGDQGGAG